MKKAIFFLSAILFGLVSCVEPLSDIPELYQAKETGLVAVTMELEIPSVQLQASTKAVGDRSELPSIKDIRVAVFGTSGYPQAYTLAEPVAKNGKTGYASTNGETYYFQVFLPVYEGEAHVHIIANGDESIPFVDQDEESIMEAMATTGNVGAFWTRVVLEDGILPEKDVNGIMTTGTDGNFLPDEATEKAFQGLVLVRNFAEVILTNESDNLTDIHWTLVNVPTTGSVAPMAAGTYVDDYKDYVYNPKTGKMVLAEMELDATTGKLKPVLDAEGNIATIYKTYDGFMFANSMDYTIPSADDIKTEPGETHPNFVYERKHPGSEKATCILVKAKFKPEGQQPDSYYTYYRLDLMNEAVGGYFPIYRNYKYQVNIHTVGNRGDTDPNEAMNRDSGGNVSLSTEALKLTDISDGTSRLYVEYTEKNFTSGGKKTLWVQYVPNVRNGEVHNEHVSVSIKDQGHALKEGSVPTLLGTSSTTGYYIYEFELNDQDENEDITSVLEVKAYNDTDPQNVNTLYRDINLRVLKKMNMTLSLVPKKVTGIQTTVLNIGLPDGLPSSMFPLEIYIEDINHTLNPTGKTGKEGDNSTITVPVKTAKSLADGTTNSFYFIRTVNESEYLADHTISTQFTTIADASATTIYVANEYFKTQSINLLNDGVYVNPSNATVAFDVTSVEVEVEMYEDAQSTTWTVIPGNGVQVTPTSGTGNGTFTMTFVPNTSTTASATRIATVRSGGVDHDVTITQLPLKLSITPAQQTVGYNATTATVTIYAEEGKAWTASVSGPTGTNPSLSATSGEGTTTLTVNIPQNTEVGDRDFTVTAIVSEVSVSATITQRTGPASPYPFNASVFTFNGNNGSATSSDGYVSIALAQAQRGNGYLTLGRRTTGWFANTYRGSITVTPQEGFRITQIRVTYSDATYAGYDFGNPSVSVTPGTYTRDGNNSSTATWTGSSTGAVTFTNGYRNNNNFPRITKIEVTYSAVN